MMLFLFYRSITYHSITYHIAISLTESSDMIVASWAWFSSVHRWVSDRVDQWFL